MKKILRTILISLAALVGLAVLVLCGITLYLTPERLSEIINREMSGYFNADVRIDNVRFTFWSTFPRFTMETDSVIIISRNLDHLSADEMAKLPADAKVLATASSLSGGINILRLTKGEYVMKDITVNDLALNIVAVNDSVNNYDILPSLPPEMKKVPFFTTNQLTLNRPKGISVFFAESDTRAKIGFDSVAMVRRSSDTSYRLTLDGEISAHTGDLTLFNSMPFGAEGNMDLDFQPFGIRFSNFDIDLMSVKSQLNMNVGLEGEMKINRLSYQISVVNIMRLLDSMPWVPLSNLQSLSADLDVNVTATLDRPYTFKSGELPWVTVNFEVPGGSFEYIAEDGRKIPLDYSRLTAGLQFNGDHPDESTIFLNPFRIESDGAWAQISGTLTHLLDTPRVNVDVTGESDLSTLSARFPDLKSWGMNGRLNFSGALSGSLDGLDNKGLEEGLRDISFEAQAELANPGFNILGYDFNASSLTLKIASLKNLPTLADFFSAPISLEATSGGTTFHITKGGVTLSAPSLTASTVINPSRGKGEILGPVDAGASKLTATFSGGNAISLTGIRAEYGEKGRSHSPYVALSANGGSVKTAGSTAPNTLGNINLYYTPDSIAINSFGIGCRSSYATLHGSVANLDDFIRSGMKAPLRARLALDCDTININQLAHTYYKDSPDSDDRGALSDTATFAIPENLDLQLAVKIKESVYTNLHLYDLQGTVSAKNGVATVDDFNISSDFGHASIGAVYDTSDIQDMKVTTDVEFKDIDIVKFFKNFHALLVMMPEMNNLKGMASLQLNGSMLIFPDMYANMASLHADVTLKGWDLSIRQNPFIHRVAQRLLIHNNNDIKINDITIRVGIRDNLLEVYPFNFEVEHLRLRALGTNNFDGNLYYHVGVDKSPLPFHFGVNIEGNFSHPKIRFGSAHYNARRGEDITLDNEVASRVNLVSEVRHFAKEFLRKAAASDK